MRYRKKCLRQKINVCNVCGSGGELVVHHINGDREDNDLDNLLPVCRGCHSIIHSSASHGGPTDKFTDKLPERSINYGGNSNPDGDSDKRIRVSKETRRRLNVYAAREDVTQDEAIRQLLDAADV